MALLAESGLGRVSSLTLFVYRVRPMRGPGAAARILTSGGLLGSTPTQHVNIPVISLEHAPFLPQDVGVLVPSAPIGARLLRGDAEMTTNNNEDRKSISGCIERKPIIEKAHFPEIKPPFGPIGPRSRLLGRVQGGPPPGAPRGPPGAVSYTHLRAHET